MFHLVFETCFFLHSHFLIKIEIHVIIELHSGNSQYIYVENGNKIIDKTCSAEYINLELRFYVKLFGACI